MKVFTCTVCRKKKARKDAGGSGYALNDQGKKVCYTCCAESDRTWMREHGRITLYLEWQKKPWEVTNWPGTLRFLATRQSEGKHNWGRTQRHVWFEGPDGNVWHGHQVGENSQLVHCKRGEEQ